MAANFVEVAMGVSAPLIGLDMSRCNGVDDCMYMTGEVIVPGTP